MRMIRRTAWAAACVGLVAAPGCGDHTPAAGPGAGSGPPPAALASDDEALFQKLRAEVSTVINDATIRYTPLQYRYSEGLLDILDQVERALSGKAQGKPTRFLPKLDAQDELDHFRETVRRWEAKTGRNLRTEVDVLKADVAARKPGERVHPEFQRRFAAVFDDLVALEVAELRERRNRAIHAAAEKILAPYRAEHAEPVRRLEAVLNAPPYNVPDEGRPK
jgi:hypothetical protein